MNISNVDVVELHDAFTIGEIIAYEALGLCEKSKIGQAILENRFTFGGRGPVVNPSGGLIARGHPISATGVAQCIELCW